jgi:hypothetical protein
VVFLFSYWGLCFLGVSFLIGLDVSDAVYVTDERPQQEIDLPSFGRMGLERSGGVTVVKPEDGSGANAETKVSDFL